MTNWQLITTDDQGTRVARGVRYTSRATAVADARFLVHLGYARVDVYRWRTPTRGVWTDRIENPLTP